MSSSSGPNIFVPIKFGNHLKHSANNNKKCLYTTYVLVCKLHTNIQQDQKAKLDHHMSVMFAYMAGGEGVGVRGFKMFCQRGLEFFLLALCVGGGVGFSTSPSVTKINDPPPFNK